MKKYPDPQFDLKELARFKTLNSLKMLSLSRTIAILLLLICAGVIAFLIITPWVQTATGTGTLTTLNPANRIQHINALVDGRIKKWYVADGAFVKKGDKIVEIVDNDDRLIERLQAERNALANDYRLSNLAAETAQRNMYRKRNLVNEGLASEREYEEARIKYKTLLSKQSQANAKLQQVEVKLSRQDTQLITAPRDGTILSLISGASGTTVKQGDKLVSFAPADVTLAVELFVDSLDMPLVHEGRKVRLQFEGWPVIQFSG